MKKFSIKNYGKPTPDNWRKFGDSLLATGLFAMTFASIAKHEIAAIAISILCIVGKFLTNFYAKDQDSGQDSGETTH